MEFNRYANRKSPIFPIFRICQKGFKLSARIRHTGQGPDPIAAAPRQGRVPIAAAQPTPNFTAIGSSGKILPSVESGLCSSVGSITLYLAPLIQGQDISLCSKTNAYTHPGK